MTRNERKIEVISQNVEKPIDLKAIAKAIAEQFKKDGAK